MTVQLLIMAGALAGLGATLIIRELLPSHPDLTDALAHLHGPSDPIRHRTSNASGSNAAGWPVGLDRLGRRLTAEVRQRHLLPLPMRDLDLLGRAVDQFLLAKLGLGLLGLAFPHALAALMGTLGLQLPLVVPVLASLALAAGLFLLPDIDVRARAQARRAEFRRAVCAYLDLVALERAGDAGVVESMERAAGVARGWAFTRIHDALLRARLDGVPPWAGWTLWPTSSTYQSSGTSRTSCACPAKTVQRSTTPCAHAPSPYAPPC